MTAKSAFALLTLDDERPYDHLVDDVRTGLGGATRSLPSRYFYDRRGCELFERITALPEYYLTRAETQILGARADQLMEMTRPQTILELGAGYSTKTRLLIDAALRTGSLSQHMPLDISPTSVVTSVRELAAVYPDLAVLGVVGDFTGDLRRIPRQGRMMVAFLGSTIGNLDDQPRAAFLRGIRAAQVAGDHLLLGVDLVKDAAQLIAAYNDGTGISAEFDRNILYVLNRELGATFDPQAFQHRSVWNPERHRMEMHLVSTRTQTVHVPGADLVLEFKPGEAINTEISGKFTHQSLQSELHAAGMELKAWFTDDQDRFGLALARPVE